MYNIFTGLITLTTDAWTSVVGISVVNFIAVTKKGTFFQNCLHAGDMAHSAENMYIPVMAEIEKLGGWKKVAGVCTDNTTTNKLMWDLLEKRNKDYNVFAFGCIWHGLHLLVGNIVESLPWLGILADLAKKVVKCFKKTQALWYNICRALTELKLMMLCLPGDTRWGSLLKCLQSLLDAWDTLKHHATLSKSIGYHHPLSLPMLRKASSCSSSQKKGMKGYAVQFIQRQITNTNTINVLCV